MTVAYLFLVGIVLFLMHRLLISRTETISPLADVP